MSVQVDNFQLTPSQKDALTEIVNMGVGRACSVLNQMVGNPISIAVPEIQFVTQKDLEKDISQLSSDVVIVRMGFGGDYRGLSAIILDSKEARDLVLAISMEEITDADLDAVMNSTLTEVGNIMINSLMGVMANVMTRTLQYHLPVYGRGGFEQIIESLESADRNRVLSISTKIIVEEMSVTGRIVVIFALDSMQEVLKRVDGLQEGVA